MTTPLPKCSRRLCADPALVMVVSELVATGIVGDRGTSVSSLSSFSSSDEPSPKSIGITHLLGYNPRGYSPCL